MFTPPSPLTTPIFQSDVVCASPFFYFLLTHNFTLNLSQPHGTLLAYAGKVETRAAGGGPVKNAAAASDEQVNDTTIVVMKFPVIR
jgi:hypothetical protein